MIWAILVASCILAAPLTAMGDEPTVHVRPPELKGSRQVEAETRTAVVRDYLQSWKSLLLALDQNQAGLLDQSFVGTAREKLANTIEQQAKLGIHTRYLDHAHDLQIVSYSPEGLSIQMTDTVEYEEQVLDHEKLIATKTMRQHYLIVLTPAEVRWRVRVFQAEPAPPN
jgi:predicted PhzF superfamily epimerase YddE/YHI9